VSPQVEAALIAAVVSLISLDGTILVAVIGFRVAQVCRMSCTVMRPTPRA